MSRLWKSCLCMLTRSTSAISCHQNGDNDAETLTLFFKQRCIDEYQRTCAKCLVEALSSDNHALCEKWLSSEAYTDWLYLCTIEIKKHVTQGVGTIDLIELLLKHNRLSCFHHWKLLEAIFLTNSPHMNQILDNVVRLMKQYGTNFILDNDEGIELVIAHYASVHFLNVMKPIVLDHRKQYPSHFSSCYENTYTFGALVENNYKKEIAEDTLTRLQFLLACGVKLRTRNSLASLAQVMQCWYNGWKNGAIVVQFLLNEGCGMSSDDKNTQPPTIVHYLIQSNTDLLAASLNSFYSSLGPMLLIKEDNELPIQLYCLVYLRHHMFNNCLYLGNGIFKNVSHEQRLKMFTALILRCPNLRVYKRCKVKEDLKRVILMTRDDQAPYDKFLKML